MKVSKILLSLSILINFSGLSSQECSSVQKDINTKRNDALIQKITLVAVNYLEKADRVSLELLRCVLNFVINQSGIPQQIQHKDELFEVIDYISTLNVATIQKNLAQIGTSKLEDIQKKLTAYGALTNDLYGYYMKKIDKFTTLKGTTAVLIKPETILPGYEKYLQDYKNRSLKTNKDIITFLLNSKLLAFDKNDPAKEPRSAQKLYTTLRQLELALQEDNKKSQLDFFGNRKRSEQITLIDRIQSALRTVYGEFILYYTTISPALNNKLAVTTETNSVVFALVALTLNTIVQEFASKVYATLHRK